MHVQIIHLHAYIHWFGDAGALNYVFVLNCIVSLAISHNGRTNAKLILVLLLSGEAIRDASALSGGKRDWGWGWGEREEGRELGRTQKLKEGVEKAWKQRFKWLVFFLAPSTPLRAAASVKFHPWVTSKSEISFPSAVVAAAERLLCRDFHEN